MRSKELSLCTIEKIRVEKQGIIDVRRISIKKKKGKTIETNTYVMTFNASKIKVGSTMERDEQFVPNPLRCYKCQIRTL